LFDKLVASHRTLERTRYLGVGFVALVAHTALIAAGIIATLHASQNETLVPRQVSIIFASPREPRRSPQTETVIPSLPTIVAPTRVPITVPLIDLDLKLKAGGSQGASVDSQAVSSVDPVGDEVFSDMRVDEPPSLLSAPVPPYPDILKQTGIQGEVLIEAVIDTAGRAERASIKILGSPDPGFDPGSRTWMLHALFRPARVSGRAVRVLVHVPLEYRITSR
jgi:TonB family protein